MSGTNPKRDWIDIGYQPPASHDDVVKAVLNDLSILSREEWMEIAHKAGQGGVGFNPMRQLQLKIRHNPLTFGPMLEALLQQGARLVTMFIDWPNPGWKKVKEWIPTGWSATKGIDNYPYRTIDPFIDNLERYMEQYGNEDWHTVSAAKDLVAVCKQFDYAITHSPDYAKRQRAKERKKAKRK